METSVVFGIRSFGAANAGTAAVATTRLRGREAPRRCGCGNRTEAVHADLHGTVGDGDIRAIQTDVRALPVRRTWSLELQCQNRRRTRGQREFKASRALEFLRARGNLSVGVSSLFVSMP